jgi:thiamine biosynthesis lipoprotein
VLSTAILAGGQETLDDATDRWDIDVLTVDAQGRLSATPRLRNSIVRPGSHRVA